MLPLFPKTCLNHIRNCIIFSWSPSNLEDLTEMLRAYKTFNTKDVEEKGSQLGSVLSSGQPLPVNKQFLRRLDV